MVQTEELDSVIARMAAFEQHLQQAVANADAQVKRMHATWSGQAAQEHLAAHARWKTDAARMQEELVRMRAIATAAHTNYTATVATNTAMWGGL
jgi:WXG100 family type VII secretion target